jgi:hypothetical protein
MKNWKETAGEILALMCIFALMGVILLLAY